MSDLFSIYEDTFNIVINKVNKIIDSLQNLSKEKSEQALNEANENINEAERYLKQMELESESNFGKNSERLKLKIRNYKSEYENVKRRFLKHQENYVDKKSREVFLEHSSNNSKMTKQKLIENEEFAYNQHDKLDKIQRQTYVMERDAIEVMKDMNHNTQKMENIDARVLAMNNKMDDNDDIIEEMVRRDQRTKYIILVTAIILFSILAIIIGIRLYTAVEPSKEEIKN